MSQIKDIFEGDGANTIFKTSEKYAEGSLEVVKITSGGEIPVSYTEIGDNYIQLNETILSGVKIILAYEQFGTFPSDNEEEYDLKQRIVKLEKAVTDLYYLNKALEKALENRVNITAFQAWLRLVEKKLGIKLIDKGLGNISQALYQKD